MSMADSSSGDHARAGVHPGDGTDALAVASQRVRRYLRFLGCDPDTLDDLAQETMLAAAKSFGDRLPSLPWLLTVARNALRGHLRRRGRRREVHDLDRLHSMWVEQVHDDGGDAQHAALRECLRELPPRARLAVDLRYREGLSHRRIGSLLGLRAGSAKSLLHRLRVTLGECVRRRIGGALGVETEP